jgi:hypothetical protein
LRIGCFVNVAVLDPFGIELEVQVCAECASGLADAADDLPGLHSLAGADSHRGHVRGHGGLAVTVFDRDMVSGPVTRVPGVEHDP